MSLWSETAEVNTKIGLKTTVALFPVRFFFSVFHLFSVLYVLL